jgi:hypothetical protein
MASNRTAHRGDSEPPVASPGSEARAKEAKRILLATNFDGASGAIIDAAASLARAGGGSIHVLCVLEALMYGVPEMSAWAERDARTHPEVTRRLEDATSTLRAAGVEQVDASVEYGIPVEGNRTLYFHAKTALPHCPTAPLQSR